MLERDPRDGKIMFIEAIDPPEINDYRDACVVIMGLHKIAEAFKEEYGFVAYPVYKIHEEQS